MCNVPQDTMDKLAVTVRQFLDQDTMFTGYDVTIETRNREHIFMRHEDVREGIHELDVLKDALDYGHVNSGNMTRSWCKFQMSLPNGKWAWLFHPSHIDPKTYVPRTASQAGSLSAVPAQNSPPVASISAVSNEVSSDSGGKQDDGTFSTDYRSRLLIPTQYLKQAGLKSGDKVCVSADDSNKIIVICKESDALRNNRVITVQTVERDGDLRLSSRTFKTADIDGNRFLIENGEDNSNGSAVKIVEIKQVRQPSLAGSNSK